MTIIINERRVFVAFRKLEELQVLLIKVGMFNYKNEAVLVAEE